MAVIASCQNLVAFGFLIVFSSFFLCVCFISHSDIILRVCNRLTDMKWRWNEEEGDGVGEGEAMDR